MKKILSLFFLSSFSLTLFAQSGYWKSIQESEAKNLNGGADLFANAFKPKQYQLFNLNEAAFKTIIQTAPNQKNVPANNSSVTISVPAADGILQHFKISQSPVMQDKLQAKHPEIKTYIGQGIEDESAVIRFDVTPLGFHAIIISADKSTVYINPVNESRQLYVVFDRENAQKKQVFDCKVDKIANSNVQGVAQPLSTSDANLRTYRFAVASGGEFSNLFLDGTETNDAQKKAKVLAGLVTDLVRTNAIFETNFGVHLNYVNDEDTIIFLDGKTDPFQSSALGYYSGAWNTQSQKTMDSYIGSANYDVGHLLMGYATGGNAGCIGCVCQNGLKGSGATGFTTDLTTDPFVVDFWDHEIGHQFGGNHTFDYSFEGTIAQMEPGSGSTIMGYAGTTGSNDIQPHSDPYFHAVSVQQIDTYITTGTGATCAVVTPTGNHAPKANAKSDFTIPKSTPFLLTGAATDADKKDVLTYCWEQYDVFKNNGTSSSFPSPTATTGPNFRSLTPVRSNMRFFPALPSILDGTNKNEWEVLPSVSRQLNFRLTVRDNHAGGSATSNDDMLITVDSTAGPFAVTYPNTAVTWNGGTKQTITWSVNKTNKAPVNCAYVQILISGDGGKTFKVLVSKTANNGSATITVPNVGSTTAARIAIVAINNIFLDISDKNFTVKKSAAIASVNSVDESAITTLSDKINVQPNPAKDYTTVLFNSAYKNCNLILTDESGKQVYQKEIGAVSKGTAEKISLSGLAKGVYFLKIVSEEKTQTQKIIVE